MEAALATCIALSLVFVCIIVRWVWSLLDWVWLKPRKLERRLRQQGFEGNAYRLLYGDMKENAIMVKEAKSKPIKLSSSHDIAPRVIPLLTRTVETYGKNSFVWFGPMPHVNILNPEDLKDVFAKPSDFPKPVSNPLIKLLATGIANYEGEKWAKHRRIINPTFHSERVKRMLPAFQECCNEMIKAWEAVVSKEGSSCELDVWPSIQNLTADVISRTAFGSSYQEGQQIFQLLKEQAVYAMKTVQRVYIPGWRYVPTKMNKRMKQIHEEIRNLVMGIIYKREKAIEVGEATKDDLLGTLLESNLKDIQDHGNKKSKNVGMSIEDVIEECKLFYFAGQETTSVLLVWTMVLLSQNQNWQNRAREEVLQIFGMHKPDFDGLTHLKVAKTQFGKFTLPAGVQVGLPTLLIHHSKELWGEDAKEFKPERFSEGVSKATKGKLSYFPFEAGPRICVGQNFAMTEAKLALALILQHFTFELSPSYAHAPHARITLQQQYGAPIMLHKR